DVSTSLAREPSIALGRDGFLRVGKLGEPLGAIVKKGEHALVVVERQRPGQNLASGVDDADALGGELGATDLSAQLPFLAVGRVVDQVCLESNRDEIGIHST